MATTASASGKTGPAGKKTNQAPVRSAPSDELHAKFREALARKQNRRTEHHSAGEGKDPNKVHDAQKLTRTRRNFRRKTG